MSAKTRTTNIIKTYIIGKHMKIFVRHLKNNVKFQLCKTLTNATYLAINDSKNIINDLDIRGTKLRLQKDDGLPPKELRSVIDQGKRDLKNGIIISISTFEEKVGVAIGVTKELTTKYDAVMLVKIASKVLGGKGGGGRKDFAQAGGSHKDKIEEAFKILIAMNTLVHNNTSHFVNLNQKLKQGRLELVSQITLMKLVVP